LVIDFAEIAFPPPLLADTRKRWPHIGILGLVETDYGPSQPQLDRCLSRYASLSDLDAVICELAEQIAARPATSDFDRLMDRARHLEGLAQATLVVSGAQEITDMLRSLKEAGRASVDADDVIVLLADDEYTELFDPLDFGVPDDYLRVCQTHMESLPPTARPGYLAAEMLLHERPTDASSESIRMREAAAAGAWSYMRLPVMADQGVIGFVSLISSKPNRFNGSHLQLGRLFAAQVSTAIRSAQLYFNLKRTDQRLQSILKQAPAAMLVCDARGTIQIANPEAERVLAMLGLALPRLIGRHVSEAVREVLPEGVGSLDLSQQLLEFSLGPGGEYLLHFSAMTDSDGLLDGYVAVAQNVTHIRQMERMKSNLTRVLTHDLGNLIMLARGPLEMLDDADLSLEQRNTLKGMLTGSLQRMEALIKDVMDLELVGALGQATMTPYHLESLVRQAVKRNQEFAQDRQITLEYQEINKPPHMLKGHAVLIMQAIDNLVSNAVKYTPTGGRVEVISTVEGGDAVVRVNDTGYGIPPDKVQIIFEPFIRLKDPRAINTPGTGLGLSLVKAFAEAHGGRVEVTSEYNRGSTFSLYLPLEPLEAPVKNHHRAAYLDLSAVVEAQSSLESV
jgi:signal transduction histidine kinase